MTIIIKTTYLSDILSKKVSWRQDMRICGPWDAMFEIVNILSKNQDVTLVNQENK